MSKYIECGNPPIDLGFHQVSCPEMMFFLYMPLKFPNEGMRTPRRLSCFLPLVSTVREYTDIWDESYCYITAKSMFVTEECPGNRPGWHIDGFLSGGDENYVWSDMNPTEYAVQDFYNIPTDDAQSMIDMEAQIDLTRVVTWPNNHLLRLDETVVHRVAPNPKPGLRTFVKITLSRHQFRKHGNSRNYLLDYDWSMKARSSERNLDHG